MLHRVITALKFIEWDVSKPSTEEEMGIKWSRDWRLETDLEDVIQCSSNSGNSRLNQHTIDRLPDITIDN